MKIRIKDDAAAIYCRQFVLQQIPNRDWADKLRAVKGMTLVVETDHLFRDQYNTVPIPGVSEIGLRIHDESVEEVIDDERLDKVKCGYCGHQGFTTRICGKCGKSKYMQGLSKKSQISLDYKQRAKAEREAGGSVEVHSGGLYIAIKMSSEEEYFFQGEEADDLEKEYKEIEWLSCSLEEYLLAIAQNW